MNGFVKVIFIYFFVVKLIVYNAACPPFPSYVPRNFDRSAEATDGRCIGPVLLADGDTMTSYLGNKV